MITEQLAEFRNRVFSSSRFQNAAASLPLVRRIAHNRARELFDLTAGFVYAQVLGACVELDLFRRLEGDAAPVEALAQECGLPSDAMRRLAKAAASLRLLEMRSGDRVGLGPQGAALLGNPSVFEMVRHHRLLYEDLIDPVAMLRGPRGETHLARFWGYARKSSNGNREAGDSESYSALMEATQAFIARDVLDAHDVSGYRHIADIGGGTGAFLLAVAEKAPEAALTLFDLPEVAELAQERFARSGLGNRARALGGDFRASELPQDADLMTLVRVLHDHDNDVVISLLDAVHRSLPPGGKLLVAEPMAGTKGASAMGDAYFGIYLWAMGSGEPRTEATLRSLMKKAGFQRIRRLSTRRPLLTGVIIGEK